MRNSICILFIFFGIQPILLSQSYQLIYSNRSALFELPNQTVVSYKVDSVTFESDSVFHFPRHLKPDTNSYDCYTVSGNWWIGGTMNISGAYNVFTNKLNDSIRIKTDAMPGENWIVYEKTDSLIVVGEVTGHNNMNFLGTTDSVKTIGFQVYDHLMNPLSSPLNNMTIQLSKHHGLIKTLNFNNFPHYSFDFYLFNPFYNYHLIEFPLIGITNPDLGKQNLTYLRAFNFEIGDELHIQMINKYYQSPYYIYYIRKQIIVFTNRTMYPDSIQYSTFVKEIFLIITYPGSDTTASYSEFTQHFTVKPDSVFDLLPSELVISDYSIEMHSTWKDGRLMKNTDLGEYLQQNNPGIFCHIHYDGCNPANIFIEGLGGPYYYCEPSLLSLDTRELKYYKKGNETGGTPLSFTNISSFSRQKSVQINPNPASDFLIISSEKSIFPLTFHLYDVFGRIAFTSSVEFSGQQIPVSHLHAGLYIYQFLYNDKISAKGRIIIE